MNAKHTPGPWAVDPKRRLRIFANDDQTVASAGGSDHVRGEWDANARLIAAAPDLLGALEAVMGGSEFGEISQLPGTFCWKSRATPSHEALDRARAAIAKARGKA